jgi:circadian clock protein KaiC
MVVVRYLELRSRLFRLISLFKLRDGAFDPTIREFAINNSGIAVGNPFEGVEAVLSGIAREVARSAALTPTDGHDRGTSGSPGQSGSAA